MIYSETLELLDNISNEDQLICGELCNITFDNPEDNPSDFPPNQRIGGTRLLNDLIDKSLDVHDQTDNDLKQINDRINEAVQENAKLEKELEELNNNLNKLKMKRNEIETFEITQEQQIYIEILRYKIKIYKLLMNTHLSYKSSNTKGYIKNKANLSEFDFNKTKLSSKDITRKYWKKLTTTTGIDCKRIAGDLLDL